MFVGQINKYMLTNSDKELIEGLEEAIENNIPLQKLAIEKGFQTSYFSDKKKRFVKKYKKNVISEEEYNQFKNLYEEYESLNLTTIRTKKVSVSDNQTVDEKYDKRSFGKEVRNEDGKIIEYEYTVYIRDEPTLQGTLSLQEMETIYKNYPYLTRYTVSNFFPLLTFEDFKRILRAFNITKDKKIPQHILEDENLTVDQKAEFRLKAELSAVSNRYKEIKGDFYQKELLKREKELEDIREDKSFFTNHIDKLFENFKSKLNSLQKSDFEQKNIITNIPFSNEEVNTLFAFISDLHFGKYFDRMLRGRGNSKDILRDRVVNQIPKLILQDAISKKAKTIHITCFGDVLESILPDGMRSGHFRTMDIFGEDQLFLCVDSLFEMIKYLLNNSDCNIVFHGIGGNHDRMGKERDDDKQRTAALIVFGFLERAFNHYMNVDRVKIVTHKNNLICESEDNISIIGHHGDQSLTKLKPTDFINKFKVGNNEDMCLIIEGHWHSFSVQTELEYIKIKLPSVCSSDDFIQDTLGKGAPAGFVTGNRCSRGYGFDFNLKTLY